MQLQIADLNAALALIYLGWREWFTHVLNLPKRGLSWVGVPEYLIPELIGPFTIFLFLLGLSLFARPVRFFLRRFLRWFIRRVSAWVNLRVADEASSADEVREKNYLKWLRAELTSISNQWHETPLVSTPAHTKKPSGRFSRYRAKLFRHDSNDYVENPVLTDAELSVRAAFGRRVRIKDLASELRHHKKVVVLGDPGSGKSVCLRQLAYDLAQHELSRSGLPATLPIYVDMGAFDTWEDEIKRKPTSVLKFVQSSLRSHSSISEASEMHPLFYVADNLERLLLAGRLTLIFDALDEMPQDSYQERYQSLKEFMVFGEAFEGNRFIFSCRLLDYDPAFSVNEIIIDRFDRYRIKLFLQKHAPGVANELYRRILDDETLEELVSNPFLLQALAYINLPGWEVSGRANELWIPATRSELLREFVEQLLTREAGIKQKKYLDSIDGGLVTLRRFLAKLGFVIQGRREGRTSARVSSLSDVWDSEPKWKELLWISRRARILGKRGEWSHELVDASPPNVEPPDRIEFVHHRLQEMFAAEELARSLSNGEPVERYLDDIWWQETVVFAVGMVEEPHTVIKQILAPQPEANLWLNEVLTHLEQYYEEAYEGIVIEDENPFPIAEQNVRDA